MQGSWSLIRKEKELPRKNPQSQIEIDCNWACIQETTERHDWWPPHQPDSSNGVRPGCFFLRWSPIQINFGQTGTGVVALVIAVPRLIKTCYMTPFIHRQVILSKRRVKLCLIIDLLATWTVIKICSFISRFSQACLRFVNLGYGPNSRWWGAQGFDRRKVLSLIDLQ